MSTVRALRTAYLAAGAVSVVAAAAGRRGDRLTRVVKPTLMPLLAGTVLAGVTPGQECYFIHSYEAKPAHEADRLADTRYGGRNVCAVAAHGSVVGCQFHPEKSGPVGLSIISQFINICQK